MADDGGLRERLGEIVRASAGNQARAFRDYGSLLDRLARRDINSAQFAREAIDLYLGALGKVASTGLTLVGETFSAGIKGVGTAAAAAAEATQSASKDGGSESAASKGTGSRGGSAAAG